MRAPQTVIIGLCALAAACSPPDRSFPGGPFPQAVEMKCTLKPVHSGVLNPTYFTDRGGEALELRIRLQDRTTGRAEILGNSGSAEVELRQSSKQLQLIETTPMGSMTITTVFAPPTADEPMPAVHSRHIQIAPANVAVSQYAGSCEAA